MTDIVLTGTKERAAELLGQGLGASLVAQSCGVSDGYISQLLAEEAFLKEVVERKYKHLVAASARDRKYDDLEDKVIAQLESQLAMIWDPMKLTKILQVLNGAKRTGAKGGADITQTGTVVNLTMPTVIVNQFAVKKTGDNHILEAGDQKLVTVQSGSMKEMLSRARNSEGNNGNEIPITVDAAPALSHSS